jgi:protein TonB
MSALRWVLAGSTALILHGAVWYAISVNANTSEGDAMDTGEMGIDLGVGQLGSYADIQERLTQLERPEPVVEKAPEKPKIIEKPIQKKPIVKAQELTETSFKADDIKPKEQSPAEETPVEQPNDESEETLPEPEVKAAPVQAAVKATGKAEQSQSGGVRGSAKNYKNQLNRWLAKYKRYPSAAKKEKQEGIVRIAFTMDRQGNVLNRQVDTSSGYPYLDAAALKMFDDANPLPPVPDDFAPGRMELPLVMPIDFTLITNTSFGD